MKSAELCVYNLFAMTSGLNTNISSCYGVPHLFLFVHLVFFVVVVVFRCTIAHIQRQRFLSCVVSLMVW
jgi:hypothetical protein